MTERQAYVAMFFFLKDYYLRTKSDDVGALLGGLRLLKDGDSADPAYRDDWKKTVEQAMKVEIPGED